MVGGKGLMFEKCQVCVRVKISHMCCWFVFSFLYVRYSLGEDSRRASPTCVRFFREVCEEEDDLDLNNVCRVCESVCAL